MASGGGPSWSESVGAFVAPGLRDGTEGQQVERLHFTLRADVGDVDQPEHLPAGSAEVHMLATGVPELGDGRLSQLLLVSGDISRAKLDPRSSRRRCVVYGCLHPSLSEQDRRIQR